MAKIASITSILIYPQTQQCTINYKVQDQTDTRLEFTDKIEVAWTNNKVQEVISLATTAVNNKEGL